MLGNAVIAVLLRIDTNVNASGYTGFKLIPTRAIFIREWQPTASNNSSNSSSNNALPPLDFSKPFDPAMSRKRRAEDSGG
jgi:hypothetical protein